MSVIVRNCPSPTGNLHIGTLRTALYNYLFAKKNNGKVVFRSEDTDKERSLQSYENNIVHSLQALGLLERDQPIIKQSERTHIYEQYLVQLLEEEKAFYCFLTPQELEDIRNEQHAKKLPPKIISPYRTMSYKEALHRVESGEKAVIRFKTPENTMLVFSDMIRGTNTTKSDILGDFVIAKDLSNALYNFAVVVDDHLMNITHVIRGEDHIPNTPKQLLLYTAFGWEIPMFAHLPLILNQDKSKLSKRKNKVSVQDYLSEGFLEEALLNFIVLLGWNPKTEQEIFSLQELEEVFDITTVHTSGAIFDIQKLHWMNSQYIKNLSQEELLKRALPYIQASKHKEIFKQLTLSQQHYWLQCIQTKIQTLQEIPEALHVFSFFTPNTSLLENSKMKIDLALATKILHEVVHLFSSLDSFDETSIRTSLTSYIQNTGYSNGQVLWSIRVALTGSAFSPGAFEMAHALGKEESIRRIQATLSL